MSDAVALEARLLAVAEIDDAFTGRARPSDVAAGSRAWPTSPEWSDVRLLAVTEADGRRVDEYRYTANDGSLQPVAVMFTQEDGQPVARLYAQHHWTAGREPMLPVDPSIHPGHGEDDALVRYFTALAAADLEASVAAFAPDGYIQHSNGDTYQGPERLREDFTKFYQTGPIKLRYCTMTDANGICALEAIMPHGRPALAVYQRSGAGVEAVRLYL